MALTVILAICALFTLFTLKMYTRSGGRNHIPGPRFSLPIFGHLHLIGAEPWVTFIQWKRLYGSLFAIKMGIYDVIVLNDSKIIREALCRPEFNGRPPFELFKSASQGKGIVFVDGPLVTEQRHFVQKCLRGFGFRTNLFEQSIRMELNQVLEGIEKECGRHVTVMGIFDIPVLNAVWRIFMGHRFRHDDPQLHRIANGIRNSAATLEGPLDALSWFIPSISKFMPELSGQEKKLGVLLEIYAVARKAFEEPLPSTASTFTDPQNFKEAFLGETKRVGDNLASSFHPTQNWFQYSAGDILIASLELTSTTLDWLLLYMLKYPAVQTKIQTEIDEKIGKIREPVLSDKENTPYVEAVIQELLRVSSVAPLCGVMHRATEDTELGGYKVNKDTLLAPNIYGVHYDEDVWGDPENFRPERFIDGNGGLNRQMMRRMLPFGSGIRSCSGEKLARHQLYLYCTSIFQRFNVSCNDEGSDLRNTVGFVRKPKKFQLTFTKRFTA